MFLTEFEIKKNLMKKMFKEDKSKSFDWTEISLRWIQETFVDYVKITEINTIISMYTEIILQQQ